MRKNICCFLCGIGFGVLGYGIYYSFAYSFSLIYFFILSMVFSLIIGIIIGKTKREYIKYVIIIYFSANISFVLMNLFMVLYAIRMMHLADTPPAQTPTAIP